MVKAYVTFFIVALPFLELFMLGYAIYHLIADIDDQNYRESEITKALTYIEVARSTTLTFWFIGALVRMLKEMHYSYNWLFQKLMKHLVIMGVSFVLSLLFTEIINILAIVEAHKSKNHNHHNLHQKDDIILHWIEFLSYVLPCLTVIFAYSAQDMFAKFNKFPEQISKVSICQYSGDNNALTILRRNTDPNTSRTSESDLLGFNVNRAVDLIDSDLLEAQRTVRDDDPDLLNRYKMTGMGSAMDIASSNDDDDSILKISTLSYQSLPRFA